jgi:cytochrome c oxidase subunit I+III
MWWAVSVGLVAVATIGFALVYAYVYLQLGADAWPLDGSSPAGLGAPAIAAVLVLAGAALAPTLRRGRLAGTAALAVAATAVVVELRALAASGLTIDTDAYGAIVITLQCFAALVLVTAVIVRTAAVLASRPGVEATGIRDADAALWLGASALWAAVWVVVHLGPRVL